MLSNLTYLHVPEWIIMLLIGIVALESLIKTIGNLWGIFASKFLGIQTKFAKKKKIEDIILSNQDDIEKLKKRQDDDHYYSKEADAKIRNDIVKLQDSVNEISTSVTNMRIDNMRTTILDFASAVGDGRIYSKEQFDLTIQLYKDYESLLEKYGMANGVVKISMEIIENQYKWNLTHHGFLEDKVYGNE